MRHFLLFVLLLSSFNLFSQTLRASRSDKFIHGYTVKLGYIYSTNHWTAGPSSFLVTGYVTQNVKIDVPKQITGHGIMGEFEIHSKHFALSFGLNYSFWNDTIHGSTRTHNQHPKAPPSYPLIADYSTSNSYYGANAIELRAQIGLKYWLWSHEKRLNIGFGIASNPRLYTEQKIRYQRTDNYSIFELGPWMGNPAVKNEAWNTSETTPVVENEQTISGYDHGFFEKIVKNMNLSFGVHARVEISKNLGLESNIGYRFQSNSRISYQNYRQNSGFYSQIMLTLDF